jgi:hypothetical protein
MEYKMRLHENTELFKQSVRFTGQKIGLPDIYVEKDYWVSYVLSLIFSNEISSDIIFKGGTALSKCYKIINRFSEDIDLVVLRREGENDNQLKKKLKIIGKLVGDELPEIRDYDLTHKRGMIRKTAHRYKKEFNGDYGQVRDVVVVEATWFGHHEPFTTKTVNSFIGEMMLNNGQDGIAKKYNLLPFEVKVLEPTRTICEKIMSLVRFSYSDEPIKDLQNKIRHTYDLHFLLQEDYLSEYFDSEDFTEMFLKVANDDIESFKNNNDWLNNHPNKALIFASTEKLWKEMASTYKDSFKKITYGDFPEEKEILDSLNRIKARLSHIDWNINTKKP